MLFDIFNIFPYYLHVNYWTGKSVRICSRKQVISGNFRRYDVYSWVCHSASLAMLNSYRRDRSLNSQLTAIKNSYNKGNV